jgi:hypothetical protein
MARLGRFLLAALPLLVPTGCTGEGDDRPGQPAEFAWQCEVSNRVTSGLLQVDAGILTFSASLEKGYAVLKDPERGRRTHAAALSYKLSAGPRFVPAFTPWLDGGTWIGRIGPGLEGSIAAGAAATFVYERPTASAAREVLSQVVPPDGWNRAAIGLSARAAGSASLSAGPMAGVEVGGEAETAAEVILYPDKGFAVTRAWRGTVGAGSSGNGPSLLGLRAGWSGSLAVSYSLFFDRELRARQLTVVTETVTGDTMQRTTRLLGLGRRARELVEGALPEMLVSPLLAASPPSAGTFLTVTAEPLLARMRSNGTTVRATYSVVADSSEYGLEFVAFGGSLQRGVTRAKLTKISFTKAGQELTHGCGLVEVAPAPVLPPVVTRPTLPPKCVPAPTTLPPTPIPTTFIETPTDTVTPSALDDPCASPSPTPSQTPTDPIPTDPTPTETPTITPTPAPTPTPTPTEPPPTPSPSTEALESPTP